MGQRLSLCGLGCSCFLAFFFLFDEKYFSSSD